MKNLGIGYKWSGTVVTTKDTLPRQIFSFFTKSGYKMSYYVHNSGKVYGTLHDKLSSITQTHMELIGSWFASVEEFEECVIVNYPEIFSEELAQFKLEKLLEKYSKKLG